MAKPVDSGIRNTTCSSYIDCNCSGGGINSPIVNGETIKKVLQSLLQDVEKEIMEELEVEPEEEELLEKELMLEEK